MSALIDPAATAAQQATATQNQLEVLTRKLEEYAAGQSVRQASTEGHDRRSASGNRREVPGRRRLLHGSHDALESGIRERQQE
eukprot:26683-Heterocapsa_arctica.AAC.1